MTLSTNTPLDHNPNPSAPVGAARRARRVRHELRRRELVVADVRPLGSSFVAVDFTGHDLADFQSLSFDDHLKFFVPDAGGEPARRDYTPRRFDAAHRTLTIEFALHGQGAASDWARRAAPGQRVSIGGPRGSMVFPLQLDWHLLAGDATALPAIHRRIEELPAGERAEVLVLVDSEADVRRFDSAADLRVTWVHSAGAWLAALRQMRLSAGDGLAWLAGEAELMAAGRAILVDEHGLARDAIRASAYWKRGATDFHETLEG